MAIQLYFSNQLEELADKFLTIVDLENQTKKNVLEGVLTIVPNQNLTKWLQLTLAKKRSVFMNFDFQYLESGLWGLLEELDSRKEKSEMIDNSHLKMFLLYALQNLQQNETAFTPFTRYLLEPDGQKGPDYAVKLWQLTEKIAHLFEEYGFHRSEMIQGWLDNKHHSTGMELCQQRLYLRMGELCSRYARKSEKKFLSMGGYAREVLSDDHGDLENHENRKFVHIFGLSQVSVFHLALIGQLKDHYDVFIYALNPSREFWEDIRTVGEKKWIQKRKVKKFEISSGEIDSGELLDDDDNELLALWGKPGRENIRLLCQLTDYDFNACFTEKPNSKSLLNKVQNDILTLSSEKNCLERLSQDTSLQVVACPGIYREVETVYNSILYNLEKDDNLRLTDIAILVPDISTYKPVIDSVFNRKPRRLSYNLVDSCADIESVYGQAILGLLALVTGRFSRKEVFGLILNPCFMDKWRIGFEEINIWADWAESLNIFHSFDLRSKKAKGYQANSFYTWKQGLQRLRLSRVLSAPEERADGVGDKFSHFYGLVPFYDINTGNADLIEKFSLVVEKLHYGVIDLACFIGPGEEWKNKLLKICDDLFQVPPDSKGETAVRQSLIESLGDLKIYDKLREPGNDKTGSGLDIEIIREFIRSNLGSISGGYGDYLTEGISISALQPMRPIPFRVVYVLGMEEGVFPGKADTSSLDLRLLKRRIGDISLPERNCYLFLEMILAVREKFYISYISRDLQKDRIMQPCSVVNQLLRYVEKRILLQKQSFEIVDIPLKGSSEKYLEEDAVNEASDVMVNYSLADRIAYYGEKALWEQIDLKTPKETDINLRRFFPDFDAASSDPGRDKKIIEKITLKELTKFLEDPVSQGLKHHLRVYDEEKTIEEITLREDEPFYSEFPVDYNLKMEPLKQWLDIYLSSEGTKPGHQMVEKIYERVYGKFCRNSYTPEGEFGELDKNALKDDVLIRAQTLIPVLEKLVSGEKLYRVFFVGEQTHESIPSINTLSVERFEPVRLTVKNSDSLGEEAEIKVKLHGQRPWIWKARDNGWNMLVLTGSEKSPGKKTPPDKYILEPLLFWMFCLTSNDGRDRIGDSNVTFYIVYKEDVKIWTYRIKESEANEYLTRLVSDYLNQKKMEWLPFEEVTSQSIAPHKLRDDEISEDKKARFRTELQEAYGETAPYLIKLANPCVPDMAFDKVRGRFRVFFKFPDGE